MFYYYTLDNLNETLNPYTFELFLKLIYVIKDI